MHNVLIVVDPAHARFIEDLIHEMDYIKEVNKTGVAFTFEAVKWEEQDNPMVESVMDSLNSLPPLEFAYMRLTHQPFTPGVSPVESYGNLEKYGIPSTEQMLAEIKQHMEKPSE